MRNLKAILCPIDFSTNSIDALVYAVHLSKKMKVKLAILHVNSQNPTNVIQKQFDNIASKYLTNSQISYEFAISRGEEKDEILRFNKIFKTNLVVMGQKGANSETNNQAGSTTKWLINCGKIAVLSIPKS